MDILLDVERRDPTLEIKTVSFCPPRKDPTQDIMDRLFNTGSLTRADRQALVVAETTPGFGADPRFAEMIKRIEKAFSDG